MNTASEKHCLGPQTETTVTTETGVPALSAVNVSDAALASPRVGGQWTLPVSSRTNTSPLESSSAQLAPSFNENAALRMPEGFTLEQLRAIVDQKTVAMPVVSALEHNQAPTKARSSTVPNKTPSNAVTSHGTFEDLKIGLMRKAIKVTPVAVTTKLISAKNAMYMQGVLSDSDKSEVRFVGFGDKACDFVATNFHVGRAVTINGLKTTRASRVVSGQKYELQLNAFNVGNAIAVVHDDAIVAPTVISDFSNLKMLVGKHVTIACTVRKVYLADAPTDPQMHHPFVANEPDTITVEVQDSEAHVLVLLMKSQAAKAFKRSCSTPLQSIGGLSTDRKVFSNMLVCSLGGLSLQSSMVTTIEGPADSLGSFEPLPEPLTFLTSLAMYRPVQDVPVTSLLTVRNAVLDDVENFYVISGCVSACNPSKSGPRKNPSLGVKLEDDSADLWVNSYSETALHIMGMTLEAFNAGLEAGSVRNSFNERFPNTVLARLRLRRRTVVPTANMSIMVESIVALQD